MKKLLGILALGVGLTGCGTMLEPKEQAITISSDTRARAYDSEGRYLGTGTNFTAQVSNRKGNDFITLKEDGNEENQHTLYLTKEHNKSMHWNLLVFPIVSYPVDLINGSTSKLARTHYAVPSFGELEKSN